MIVKGDKIKLKKKIGTFGHIGATCTVIDVSEDGIISFRYKNKYEGCISEDVCAEYFDEVLYNLSYGNNNRDGMFKAINTIITQTPFTIADVITWKKSSAMPNNCSPNKLTRITEFVFVFCKKDQIDTFYCNKPIVSYRKTGQASYGNIFNFIEAKNNDGSCPYNKATYSSDLCKQLLNIYGCKDGIVYDPFMGTGTTAVACKELSINYIGSEISKNQCEWAENRLSKA